MSRYNHKLDLRIHRILNFVGFFLCLVGLAETLAFGSAGRFDLMAAAMVGMVGGYWFQDRMFLHEIAIRDYADLQRVRSGLRAFSPESRGSFSWLRHS